MAVSNGVHPGVNSQILLGKFPLYPAFDTPLLCYNHKIQMSPVEKYFQELCDIRSAGAGVKETSYYTALANLLADVGKTLKPRVRCILQLKNRGARMPDGGLFTPDQFPKGRIEGG